jgi:hypothetical protein
MYAIFTHHDAKYQPLADLTWDQNKLLYAQKHGYATHVKTDNFQTAGSNSIMSGFEKIYMARDLLRDHPEYKWIWWVGTDTMITNMEVRMEDRVMNQYHFIVAVDANGINADSFLVQNTPEGRAIIDDILSHEEECMKYWDTEQRAMCLTLGVPVTADPSWPAPGPVVINEKYTGIAKIVAQKYMNAYNYSIYREHVDHRDKSGVNGNWTYGDWLIHWPALSIPQRIELFHAYMPLVVR